MGMLTLRDGSVEILGDNKPVSSNLSKLVREMEDSFGKESSFSKPDFFLPMPVLEGISSSEQL